MRLMAALTRVGHGNTPGSTPNSPRHRGHGRGRTDRTTSSFPIPIMAKLVWNRLPQPTAYLLVAEQQPQVKVKGMSKVPKMDRVMLQTRRTPVHFSVSDVKVGATWLRSVLHQPNH